MSKQTQRAEQIVNSIRDRLPGSSGMSERLRTMLKELDESTHLQSGTGSADINKAYIAGFLDADGSVALHKTGKDNFRQPVVEFFNNDYVILESLTITYGGKVHTRKARKDTHADSYELRLSGEKALDVIADVLPYMRHYKKKFRAYLIHSFYKQYTPRNGKYTPEQLAGKRWLEEEVMSIQMRGPDA